MRILLDACVLYPTIMREVLLGAAKAGAFEPVWSHRILEEWRRAAARHGPEQEQVAGVDIALCKANWPQAAVNSAPETGLWLPDENDIHVLASAIHGHVGAIITLNLKDFPTRILSNHHILRRDPDSFLLEFAHDNLPAMQKVARDIQKAAEHHSGAPKDMRNLLKRTRLPRLGKFLTSQT